MLWGVFTILGAAGTIIGFISFLVDRKLSIKAKIMICIVSLFITSYSYFSYLTEVKSTLSDDTLTQIPSGKSSENILPSSEPVDNRNATIQKALADAAEIFSNGNDYENAIKVINYAIAEVGEDDQLLKEIAKYKEYMPVLLSKIDYYSKDKYIQIGKCYDDEIAKDVLGNTYSKENLIYPSGEDLNYECASDEADGEVEYLLNAEYATLSGTLYLPYLSRAIASPNIHSVFKVYGDDILLYEAPEFIKGVIDPVEISIDISGVRILKIVVLGVWYEGTGWTGLTAKQPMVCAANLTVVK